MLPVLYRKLWRELWQLRGQVLAIALVIGGGVAVCVMSLVNYSSLSDTRDQYYRESRFADVFVDLTRAPRQRLEQVQQLDGVARLQARIQTSMQLQVPGFADPVSGRVLSLPDRGEPLLNHLHLRSGRFPDARRDNEVVVIGSFAEAHNLAPGDTLLAIINGRHQRLHIVGVAESSEFIYVIPPGSMLPDYHRYAILWMAQRPLQAVTDMTGAFNNLLLALQPDVSQQTVIDQLDLLFRPYGSTGAYGRSEQFSGRFLSEELKQLRTMAILFPAIFMSVAMFLINVVISRLIDTQRDVIAVLKAFGYSNAQVSLHYGALVTLIMVLGLLIGIVAGLWLGDAMANMYRQYFRFPELIFRVPLALMAIIAVLSVVAGWLGAWGALARVFRLDPAQAMGPEQAPHYQRALLERVLTRWQVKQLTRMLVRGMEHRPLRTMLAVLGVAFATAIIAVGTFQFDSVSLMVHTQFQRVQQEDMTVSLVQPRTAMALHELTALPGVRWVEGSLVLPVRLHNGHRSWRTVLTGVVPEARLTHRVDMQLTEKMLPAEGLLLTEFLMQVLHLAPGDAVTVEWLDGSRREIPVRVAGETREFIGVGAYMALAPMQALYGRGPQLNQLHLSIDPEHRSDLLEALRQRPLVAGVSERQSMLDAFYETLGRTFLTFTFINSLLGGVIAFGVVYNTVRISLAERGRELTSLRVLGYRPAEVDHILLSELALLLLLGIPLGWMLGRQLAWLLVQLMQSEIYRVPLLFSEHTLGLSGSVVILSALVSALIAIRRVAKLDLIRVLKTRE